MFTTGALRTRSFSCKVFSVTFIFQRRYGDELLIYLPTCSGAAACADGARRLRNPTGTCVRPPKSSKITFGIANERTAACPSDSRRTGGRARLQVRQGRRPDRRGRARTAEPHGYSRLSEDLR